MKEKYDPDKSLFSDSLISLASSDIESSRLLHTNGIYHNSLFLLQQSVEKLVKAIGLDLGIVETNKMPKISHSPHKVYKAAVDQTIDDFKKLDEVPKIKELLIGHKNYSEYITTIESLSLFFNEQHKYDFEFLEEEELTDILQVLEYLANNPKLYKVDHTEFCQLLYNLISTVTPWHPSQKDRENFEEKIKTALDIELEMLSINHILLWLSLVTQKHQDTVRYPCKCCGDSPLVRYGIENPLVKYFGNLHNLQIYCLSEYSRIRRRMKTLLSTSQEEE